ncbi:MAG: flagellar motor switch protein FliN [Woeseiaceae bacterium]|nr:flagellar motor switch protein FliN [Woeseiaceae bacterium]
MATEETGNEETQENNEGGENAAQFSPDELSSSGTAGDSNEVNLDLVLDIPVNISLRVGSTEISIRDLVRLVEGSVIALDRDSSEPLDVLVNGTLIAHGEIVVVDDRFGVRLTDVVSPLERIEKLS